MLRSQAEKAFVQAAGDDGILSIEELLDLQGVSGAAAARLVEPLMRVYAIDEEGGMPMEEFVRLHFDLTKQRATMVKEGDELSATGELLVLHAIASRLRRDRVVALEERRAAREKEDAMRTALKTIDDSLRAIEKAASMDLKKVSPSKKGSVGTPNTGGGSSSSRR